MCDGVWCYGGKWVGKMCSSICKKNESLKELARIDGESPIGEFDLLTDWLVQANASDGEDCRFLDFFPDSLEWFVHADDRYGTYVSL